MLLRISEAAEAALLLSLLLLRLIGATIQLGQVLHSQVFTMFGAIAVCVQVLIWLCVLTRTCGKAWTGQLFHAPCLTPPKVADIGVHDNQSSEEFDAISEVIAADTSVSRASTAAVNAARDLEVQLSQTVGSYHSRGGSYQGSLAASPVDGKGHLSVQDTSHRSNASSRRQLEVHHEDADWQASIVDVEHAAGVVVFGAPYGLPETVHVGHG